jgi:peptidoglycan hydrolase-like protein with peptidoglycan-binding domain
MSRQPQSAIKRLVAEVELIGNTNVREAPTRSATVLRVLRSSEAVMTAGFTTAGETIQGNSAWYFIPDGSYIWAGATTRPNPAILAPVSRVAETTSSTAVAGGPAGPPIVSGIARIDELLSGATGSVGDGDGDAQSIGALQDLLAGHGFRGLPGPLSAIYGKFGPKTQECLRGFQKKRSLSESGIVDRNTLDQLLQTPAVDPRISQVYTTLVLNVPHSSLHRVLSLTAIMEGLGRFGSLNLNTDRAGLSFGIIQWAQRPRRLGDILDAFAKADLPKFITTFGGGDEDLAAGLLTHVRKPAGGVDSRSGAATDSAYDLVSPIWAKRFQDAALDRQYQRIQIDVAAAAFRQSLNSMRKYATDMTERTAAFMLDVANQCGDGGLREMYGTAKRTGATGMDLLEVIADETVERVAPNLQAGVRMRRDNFLNTPLLSDQPFVE